jgi:hypothetical protein
MPFPLAHPAAVLPLRRYCPRWLSFPALVVGSLVPDAGYALVGTKVGILSHQLWGSLIFCLPVGLVSLGLFYGFRRKFVGLLPTPYQEALLPWCRRPIGAWWIVLVSLLVGTWTHLLWDSFTHNEGWFVQQLPALQAPVVVVGNRTLRVCHLLWYGCSFGGILCLFLAFERWKRTALRASAESSGKGMVRDGLVLALLVLPIELVHHLIRGGLGVLLVAAFSAVLVAGLVWKLGRSHRRAQKASQAGRRSEICGVR